MLIMLANQRRVGRCLWLMALLLFATGTTHARTLRKVHATIPYTVEGKQTVIGADGTPGKFGLGAQVVFYHTMMDSRWALQQQLLLLFLLLGNCFYAPHNQALQPSHN